MANPIGLPEFIEKERVVLKREKQGKMAFNLGEAVMDAVETEGLGNWNMPPEGEDEAAHSSYEKLQTPFVSLKSHQRGHAIGNLAICRRVLSNDIQALPTIQLVAQIEEGRERAYGSVQDGKPIDYDPDTLDMLGASHDELKSRDESKSFEELKKLAELDENFIYALEDIASDLEQNYDLQITRPE
jgi:hypothetical protein